MAITLFGAKKAFIGVVHLLPLPGSPRWRGDMDSVLRRAEEEAIILDQGGAHGIIVENFGDAPFRIGRVEPETAAAMTLALQRVRQATKLPVGVNVLRNDAQSALAIAAVTGAEFIRVNVHYGVMAADEGLVQGEAFETLRRRRALNVELKILADVLVKHAVPLGPADPGPHGPRNNVPRAGRRANHQRPGDGTGRLRLRHSRGAGGGTGGIHPGRQRRGPVQCGPTTWPSRRRDNRYQLEAGRVGKQPR